MFRKILILISVLFVQGVVGQETPIYEDKFKFLENKGQWPDFVLYRAATKSSKMYLEQGRVLYQFVDGEALQSHHGEQSESEEISNIRTELITANFLNSEEVEHTDQTKPSTEYYNFFIGDNQDNWASKVYGYADVVLNDLYKDIDVHYNNEGDHLKYEFIVKSGADPDLIQIRYDNAKSVKITREGGLRVQGKLGVIEERKPYVYQIKNGKIIEVECNFKVDNNVVQYELGDYDERVELVIDPDLIFASYSGSASDNFGMTATYDNDGNLYSGGIVFGNAYPTTAGAYDEDGNLTNLMPTANDSEGRYGVTDIFISKYSSDGTTMLYSTYIGGGDDNGGTEVVHSIICNNDNELYFYGTTSSDDFPLVNAYQTNFNGGVFRIFDSNGTRFWGSDGTQASGGTDLIVGKLSNDGSNLLGSTYLGGSENDGLNYNEVGIVNGNNYGRLMYNYGDPFRGEIMLDKEGNCFVASCTYSPDFPIVNPVQSTYGGEMDGVLFKFSPDLSNLLWSTYIGGQSRDACYAVKFDENNDIFVAGGTMSVDFPTSTNVIQETHNNTSLADGFIMKYESDGTAIIHSTLLGTDEYDQAYFMQIDRNNKVFVLGQTEGEIQPTPDTYNNPNSGQFIMQLENDLSSINFQTIFGNGNGEVNISPTAFLVDICGNIYVSGWGGGIAGSLHQLSPVQNMPITSDAYQPSSGDGYNFYLIVLSASAEDLVYASYLGGDSAREHVDGGTSRFDEKGIVYHSACGGCGGFSDFPTFPENVWSLTNESSNCNNLVFKFDFNLIPSASAYSEETVVCEGSDLQLQNESVNFISYEWDFGNGQTSSSIFSPTIVYEDTGTYEITLVVTDSVCLLSDTTKFTIEVIPKVKLEVSDDIYQCEPSQIQLVANTNGTADEFIWSSDSNFSDTLNSVASDSVVDILSEEGGYFYIKASNGYCEQIDSVLIFYTSANLKLEGETKLCIGDTARVLALNTNDTIAFNNFLWEPDSILINGQGGDQVYVYTLETQYLTVVADASNGCVITDSILIEVSDIDPTEIIASSSDDSVPEGTSVTLTAEPKGDYNYNWTPPDNMTDPSSQMTDVIINETTTFMVDITDGICLKTSHVEVKTFGFVCEEPFVYVPNAFTPNGDGENDILFVRSSVVEELVFRIYNRWGELVFETTDINRGWDGEFKGKPSDPDVYDYYLEGFCIDGQEMLIQGNITLIR